MRFRFFVPFLLSTLLFASSVEELYNKAAFYEQRGDIKKALEFYKKVATVSLKKSIDKKEDKFADIKKTVLDSYSDKETKESVAQILDEKFGVQPYKMNYILPATYDFTKQSDRKQFETKFQISFKKKIASNLFGFDERYYLSYTQISFWQTAEKSSPFRESNYEPEAFVIFPYKNNSPLKAYKIALVHQSNGQSGSVSRSWNRVYLQAFFQDFGAFISPRVWYRIPEHKKTDPSDTSGDDNPDIYKYLGYGDLTISYPYKKHLFSVLLRNNFNSPNRGAVQFDWTFPILNNKAFGYIQLFSGYGESLIDYNRHNDKIGIGFAITR